jgi:hypothetical protein
LSAGLAGAAAESEDQPPIKVYADSKRIPFAVPPELVEESTLVPFRTIFEALGLKVSWEQETETATGTKGNFEIRLRIGQNYAQLNGRTVELAAAPRIMHEMTFVPLRFVGEATGRDVTWNENTREIYIDSSLPSYMYEALYSTDMEYKGEKQDGVPHGQGQYWYKGKLWYEGQFANGVMEGKGRWTGNEASYYEGEFHNNLMDGTGKTVFEDGTYYTGSYVKGKQEGEGKIYSSDNKLLIEGRYEKNKLNGKATVWTDDAGGKIVGNYKDNELNGEASVYSKGSLIFRGQFMNGKEFGYGSTYSDGKVVFEGIFYGDNIVKGKLYHEGSLLYEGTFLKNKPHGTGTFYEQNGEIHFQGDISYSEKTGRGIIYSENKPLYSGEVYRGKPYGEGALHDTNGDVVLTGFFFDGEVQSAPDEFKKTPEYRLHLLEKQLSRRVIEGLNVKNMDLTAEQAIMYLYIHDDNDLATFKALSKTDKEAFINDYVQSHWDELIGAEECIIFVYCNKVRYAAAITDYGAPSSQLIMKYYPDGGEIEEVP